MKSASKLGTELSTDQSKRGSKADKKPAKKTNKTAKRATLSKKAPKLKKNKKTGQNMVSCQSCGLCCSYVAYEINPPTTAKRATEILWHLYHPNVSICFDGEEWYGQLESRCQHNGPDNRCKIYSKRPHICRLHDENSCEINGGEEGLYFKDASEFLYYLKQHKKRIYNAIEKDFVPLEDRKNTTQAKRKRRSDYEKRYKSLRDQLMN